MKSPASSTPASPEPAPDSAPGPSPGGGTASKAGKERPKGRRWRALRRWLIRGVLWIAALLAFLVFVGTVSVRSAAVREALRLQVVDRLSSSLERSVTLEEVDFSLLPPVLELQDLRVAAEATGDPPVLTVERLRLEGAILNPWRRRWRLRQVEVVRPHLRLTVDPEGEINLPLPEAGDGGQVRIGALLVEDGVLEFEEQQWPLTLNAQDVRARMVGEGPGRLQGQATAASVQLRLPQAENYPLEVTVNGRYGPGEVILDSVRAVGEGLSMDAAGSVSWGRSLRESGAAERYLVELETTLRGSSQVLTDLGYLNGELSGPLRTEGVFQAWDGEWGYQGTASSPELEWSGRRLESLSGELSADRERVHLDLQRGSYAGGDLRGWAVVELESPTYPVEVDLDFRGVPLDRLLASEGLSLSGFASVVDGELDYRSVQQGRDRGYGWGQFEISPTSGPGVALAGTVPLTIEDGLVSSQAVLLGSERQRLFFGGSYDLARLEGAFDYELNSHDLVELSALLLPFLGGDAEAPWVPQSGEGQIQGSLAVSRGDPTLAARLNLRDVATSQVAAERVRGSVQVENGSVDYLSVELMEGEAALLITGTVRPQDSQRVSQGPTGGAAGGSLSPSAPAQGFVFQTAAVPGPVGDGVPRRPEIELDFDALDWPLNTIGYWRDLNLPLAGPVSGRLSLVGDGVDLSGRIRAAVAPAELLERSVEEVRGELAWDSEGLDIRKLMVTAAAGSAEVQGSFDPVTGAMDLDVESELELAGEPLASLLGGGLAGRVRLEGTLGGSLEDPRVELAGEVDAMQVLGRSLARPGVTAAQLEASWDGERVEAEGELLGLLRFAGGGALDRSQAALDFAVSSPELRGLVELVTDRPVPELEGELAGRLRVRGPVTEPSEFVAELELDRLEGGYSGAFIEQLEPTRATLQGTRLTVDSLYLGNRERESDFFATGALELAPGGTVDLSVQSSLSTLWLRPVVVELGLPEEFAAPGRFDLLGRLVGPLDGPYLDGQAQVTLEPFVIPTVPQAVEDLNARIAFYQDRAELENLEARVGDGRIVARGTVEREPDGGIGGYQVYTHLEDLKVLFPEGWLQQGDAELWLSSSDSGRDLQGLVELEQVRYLEDLEVGLGNAIQGLLETERQEVGSTNEWLAGTRVDLLIEAPQALRVRNRSADLRGDLDLELRGTLARPVLLGTIDVQPGGTLVYADNEYRIERGLVTFANLYRTEPVVDLVATSRVRSYEVVLNLSGTPERLEVDVNSDPPLPQLDLMALVAGGAPVDRNARPTLPGSTDDGQLDAQAFLYGQAASAITDRVNVLFGLDKLRVDPLPNSTGSSSVRLTVGKRLSNDFYITYSRDPSTTEEDILEAEWQVTSNLVLVFTQNGDGSFSVDALWDQRF
ncbi:MAG: translocation/assembly module TamB domain-containing protein [Acidobacteriota bacterium]|nr:translocation/assembly module TamB domain-containing protein [Acidobacteriota bacterium]